MGPVLCEAAEMHVAIFLAFEGIKLAKKQQGIRGDSGGRGDSHTKTSPGSPRAEVREDHQSTVS